MSLSDEQPRLQLAHLRNEIREIDTQIARVRADDRLFRRYGFSSELNLGQLAALRTERQDKIVLLHRLQHEGTGSAPAVDQKAAVGSGFHLSSLLASVLPARIPRVRPA